jgi:hypothetical protein
LKKAKFPKRSILSTGISMLLLLGCLQMVTI